MFITTAGRTNQQMMDRAAHIAEILKIPYIHRKKKSIALLQKEQSSDCLVVGKERLELYEREGAEPFFFHPNSAMFRIKRLINGVHDPFAEATGLVKGMSFLDCTLGLASDSIIASFLVGKEGQVLGIEGNRYIAYLVGEGLQTWESGMEAMDDAMREMKVIHTKALDFLEDLPDASFDCVYFDPMFKEGISESDGIKPLGQFALYDDLSQEIISQAKRVAKKRIILKDHYKSERFSIYGFQVSRRKSAKFHFGIYEK